jgi:hypothetical protein
MSAKACRPTRSGRGFEHRVLLSRFHIDITASQFDSALPKVLFSDTIGWHKRFKIIEVKEYDSNFMHEYASPEKEQIMNDYQYLSTATEGHNQGLQGTLAIALPTDPSR